jgi:hypothetical protein
VAGTRDIKMLKGNDFSRNYSSGIDFSMNYSSSGGNKRHKAARKLMISEERFQREITSA